MDKKVQLTGYFLGFIALIFYVLTLFTLGSNFIFGLPYIPFLLLFPHLSGPSNIYSFGISGIIGVAMFPIVIYILSKIFRIKASLRDILYGFLVSIGVSMVVSVFVVVMRSMLGI